MASETNAAYRAGIARDIAQLRRRILFLHPDLQFDRLLCVQRGIPYHHDPHEVDQYVGRYSRPGPGLIALDDWKTVPRKTELLNGKLPKGTVLNPDLHWNADRVLFAFCDHEAKPPADLAASTMGGSSMEEITYNTRESAAFSATRSSTASGWIKT